MQPFPSYPPLPKRYLFQTGHLQSLSLLNHLDEGRRLGERIVRTRIEPCETAAEQVDLQLAILPKTLDGLMFFATSTTLFG